VQIEKEGGETERAGRDMADTIVYIHRGDGRFLTYAIAQAQVFGLNIIIVAGDEAVRNSIAGSGLSCDFRPLADLWRRAADFERIYRHLSTNQFDFELFCYQRWFVMSELLTQEKRALIYSDSDILIYDKFDQSFYDSFMGPYRMFNTAWFNIFKDADCLELFLNYMSDAFRSQERIDSISAIYRHQGQPQVSDMYMWHSFAYNVANVCADIWNWGEAVGLDSNIRDSRFHVMSDGLKDVTFRFGTPYCHILDQGGVTRFRTLHFQGYAKPLMQVMNNVPIELANTLADFFEQISEFQRTTLPPEDVNAYRHNLLLNW